MRSRTPLIALTAAAALALTGCAGGGTGGGAGGNADGKLANDKSFTLVISSDPGNLNPITTALSVTRALNAFTYASLVSVGPDGGIRPYLAEKWENDTEKATFTLRDGMTCEDGTPITATTVADNLNFVADPANGSAMLSSAIMPGSKAVADDAARTVTVTSGTADAFLLENVGAIPVVCSTVLKDPDALAKGKGATGMFKMAEINPNSQYTMERRTEFTWGPEGFDAKADGLPAKAVFRVVPNATTAANLLLSGEVNVSAVDGPDRARVEAKNFYATGATVPTGQIYFNQADGRPTKDLEVRKAIIQALDLVKLRKVLTDGLGTAPTGLVTVDPNPCRDEDTVKGNIPEFDSAAAAKTFADAGWKAGSDGVLAKDGMTMKLTLLYSNGSEGHAAVVESMQKALKKLGVELTLKPADSPGLAETLFKTGEWDISTASLTVALPTSLMAYLGGPASPEGTNFSHIDNAGYNEAVALANTKAGKDGCGDWAAAETSVIKDLDVVPYANLERKLYGNKTKFDGAPSVDPLSIRMYE